jgi:hypothetical protein
MTISKELGREIQKDLQQVLVEWRNMVFGKGATGLMKAPSEQRIASNEK